jgi:probable F420-dependent oxidoreductase
VPQLKIGVWLSRVRPELFLPVTQHAEQLGFESVWLSEHLVLPATPADAPAGAAEHASISGATPVFDVMAYLSFLAGATSRIRLGSWVYLLGLRHPFVAARAAQTLDIVSGGRAEIGIGAGWLEAEWVAAGLPFASRGRRLDEAIDVCRRLWTEPSVEHHGEFYDFPAVGFEPKPVRASGPAIHVGGESTAALRRAAARGDGWIGGQHTPASAALVVQQLTELRSQAAAGDRLFDVTVGGAVPDAAAAEAWLASGVTRVIVDPWRRSSEAVESLTALAGALDLEPEAPGLQPGVDV